MNEQINECDQSEGRSNKQTIAQTIDRRYERTYE